MPVKTLTTIIAELFSEAYDGPNHAYTWLIDNAAGSGVLGTLETISVEEASTPMRENGTTVAAHAEHLRWSLALADAYARGETRR